MATRACDLHIVFSRIPADVATVVLMGWNDATAWHVFAWLRLSIGHFISLLSFFDHIVLSVLHCFLFVTAVARNQTRYRNRDVEHAGHRLESGHHTCDWCNWNDIAVA